MDKINSVSVVMCTYNGASFIDEQMDSITKQDISIDELIIVDDCSTDDTWTKLLSWQEKYPYIKLYQNKENIGYNKNFAKALKLASSNFIALSDQDDIWLPQKLGKLLNAFTNSDIILVHSRSVRLDNGELKYRMANLHRHFTGNDTRQLLYFNHIMGHDMMFRKTLVDKLLPIPAGMSYDWWIAVVATCYGTVGGVHEFLVHHRIHAHNNFFSSVAASKKEELDLEDTLRLFFTIPGMKPAYRAYLHQLLTLLSEKRALDSSRFYPPLFRFLYKHRKVIFGHKRRFMPEFSYFKNAVKYAKMNYKGKGLSF